MLNTTSGIPKPTNRHAEIERGTSMLYFEGQTPHEFYLKGGLCYPASYEIPGEDSRMIRDIKGYAVMAGMDIRTKIVYVFEATSWRSIDNIIDPQTGRITEQGLSHWFNNVWGTYFARKFYWHQRPDMARRYHIEIIRSQMIRPQPEIIEAPTTDVAELLDCIWLYNSQGRLKYTGFEDPIKKTGPTELHQQLEMVRAGDKQLMPAVHALGCCLLSMERFPLRLPVAEHVRMDLLPRQVGELI